MGMNLIVDQKKSKRLELNTKRMFLRGQGPDTFKVYDNSCFICNLIIIVQNGLFLFNESKFIDTISKIIFLLEQN